MLLVRVETWKFIVFTVIIWICQVQKALNIKICKVIWAVFVILCCYWLKKKIVLRFFASKESCIL
jgi:hypothetical protein